MIISITGAPGTGKTQVLCGLHRHLRVLNEFVTLVPSCSRTAWREYLSMTGDYKSDDELDQAVSNWNKLDRAQHEDYQLYLASQTMLVIREAQRQNPSGIILIDRSIYDVAIYSAYKALRGQISQGVDKLVQSIATRIRNLDIVSHTLIAHPDPNYPIERNDIRDTGENVQAMIDDITTNYFSTFSPKKVFHIPNGTITEKILCCRDHLIQEGLISVSER